MREFAEWLQATPASVAVQSTRWVIPVVQSIHILMIGLVFVSVLVIALRVLGRARADESPAAVWSRFAPWLWYALIIMAATGVVLIIGEPVREFTALSFWLKMALVAVGALSTAQLGRSLRGLTTTQDRGLPGVQKVVVVATVLVWLAVIFLGRAIAYDKEVWGALT